MKRETIKERGRDNIKERGSENIMKRKGRVQVRERERECALK